MRIAVVPLLVAVVAAAPLAAQSNAERIANDRYTRSHDYDLIHQRITLGDFDWDSTSFTGSVSTTLVSLRAGMDSVILDAGKLLRIKRVSDARGAALTYDTHGDTLVVHLARPAAFRDTVRFGIDYAGRVDNGRGLTFLESDGRPHRPQQIWSQGEDMNNHLWFPTYDFPNDKMTWEMEVTVPAAYTAVSNGRLVSDTRGQGGTRTMRWRQDRPSATYLVSIVVAPLVKISDSWRGVPVDYYVYRADSALARPLFRVTPDMIDVYSRLTGVAYPWAKYAQTTVADFFGGMENVSATTLVDWLPDARAYIDRPWYQHILIPHELAHQWFGDYTTTENWANMWLNEGFAEFMPGQYWAAKGGRHAEDDYYIDEYSQFLRIDAQRRMPLASYASNNIYPKGALVLEMLERYLGAQRFWASVHTYLGEHAFGNATSDDFRQAVLEATGENLYWFWDQWIYQAGYPEFVITSAYDAAARRLTLVVKQTQSDTTTPPDSTGVRFTTPSVFRMPVTIRVGTAGGDVIRQVPLDAREQTIQIDGVNTEPTMVVFDDGNAILKKLAFDQPTAWLATQLRRDPDLWNRWWVIQSLAKHRDDPAAGAALADAARRADYFLTRQQAATVLAVFPAAIALPALASAARDTSAQVRAAAVAALGQLGGAEAAGIARTAFAGDPSYAVRAASLTALVRLEPAAARTMIARGLSTPSYQDAIQNAALGAIARTNDTTFIDALDRMLTQSAGPSQVLGVLGSRGSTRALDLLTHHLDDADASARRFALGAFANAMDPKLALERLKAVAGTLTHQDTRRGVSALISTLEKRPPGS